MKLKTALIYGITGQDGSYLSELLLNKNYRVVGVKRRSSSVNTTRLTHLMKGYSEDLFSLIHGDITDTSSVFAVIEKVKPDEIYNLAAQSHVGVSFNEPEYTSQVDALGTLRLLEACKTLLSNAKLYQASTSELYGGLSNLPLNEDSPFNPRSPYAVAKLYAYYLVQQYREAYNMPLYNGILFNHESPRRGENFVSRKITLGIKEIMNGGSSCIYLGNLDAVRDWGHAKDYVRAMNLMLESTPPGDYVIATGQCYSIRDFCIAAFEITGHKLAFKGNNKEEVGFIDDHVSVSDSSFRKIPKGSVVIRINPIYFRPLDVPYLLGNSNKFRIMTGWSPQIEFKELVREMVMSDVDE